MLFEYFKHINRYFDEPSYRKNGLYAKGQEVLKDKYWIALPAKGIDKKVFIRRTPCAIHLIDLVNRCHSCYEPEQFKQVFDFANYIVKCERK